MRLTYPVATILVLALSCTCPAFAQEKEKKQRGKANRSNGGSASSISDAEKAQRKAERKAEKAVDAAASGHEGKSASVAAEDGGDESELATISAQLGLSDDQKKAVTKEYEKFHARLDEIKGLPDSTHGTKLLKGPQRRALRADLDKWVAAHLSPAQAQDYDAYAKKRAKDLFDQRLNNRIAKLDEALKLAPGQQEKLRSLYAAQMSDVQSAADALYAASSGKALNAPDIVAKREALEKELELKRDALRTAVQALLKPDQIELFKNLEDL